MDWFTQLEKRRSTAIFLILFLALAVLAASALREPFALDSFWHLKMGQDWIEKGLSPFRDHYSITHYGEPVVGPPFIFQVVIYGFVSLFGVNPGFKAFVFASSLMTLGFLMVWLRQIKAPLPVLAICVYMLIVFLQMRVMVRPELLSYSLIIFSLVLYEKARNEYSHQNFFYIVIFMLFWRNYHSAILGYVIFAGLFIDIAVQQVITRSTVKSWLIWGCWGLAVFATGFFGQDLIHPVIAAATFSQEWNELIGEYRPVLKGLVSWATLALVPVAIFTLLGLLHQRLFGYFMVGVVFSWYAMTISRMTAPGGVVLVCLFALVLTRYDLKKVLTSGPSFRSKAVSGALFFAFVAVLLLGVLGARVLISKNLSMLGYFPDRLVEYMKQNELHGRIFNAYNVGGYLIYHLGDTSRVYIDGRTGILYPIEHMKQYRAAAGSPGQLLSEIEKHDIDYLVMSNQRSTVDLVRDAGAMQLDYSDLRYSLYAKNNAKLPISGSIWSMPWCWNEHAGEALMTEIDQVFELVPEYSPVSHYVTLASEFHRATNPEQYLYSIREQDPESWYEDNLRFAGYRALELGLNELAINWFFAVRKKYFKDYMAGSMAYLQAGRLMEAETILADLSATSWTLSDPNDFELLYRILMQLQSRKKLELIDQSFVDQVATVSGHQGQAISDQPLSFQIFCQ
jgi:hypothetical protein